MFLSKDEVETEIKVVLSKNHPEDEVQVFLSKDEVEIISKIKVVLGRKKLKLKLK